VSNDREGFLLSAFEELVGNEVGYFVERLVWFFHRSWI
ncbi:unnamed protein product, partial [Acidithrix sp. C25]